MTLAGICGAVNGMSDVTGNLWTALTLPCVLRLHAKLLHMCMAKRKVLSDL